MEVCKLCPRNCGVSRQEHSLGVCGQTEKIHASRAALHFWEEPCISGSRGSGAVFFCGCNLKCIFCQNYRISQIRKNGKEISAEQLAGIFLRLQEQGAHNINLVTPTHFARPIGKAIESARRQGLVLPVIYNCGGYEKVETLQSLEGLIDIYMPDFKYMDAKMAADYSGAPDYPEIARAAIAEMYRQTGHIVMEDGLMKKGVLVRHLVLPLGTGNAKRVCKYLYETYQNAIYISIMNQYTPPEDGRMEISSYPHLLRRLTAREYRKVVDYAISLGITNAFIQEGDTARESFIPVFDGEGL